MKDFWKKIEKIYVVVDDDFGKEEVTQYKKGNLEIPVRDVKSFFWGGLVPIAIVVVFDLFAIATHFTLGWF